MADDDAHLDDDAPGPVIAPPRGRGFPSGTKRGICTVCGDPAYSRHATKCETHRGVKKDAPPTPRPSGEPSATRVQALELELRTNIELYASLWAMRDPFCAGVLLPPSWSQQVVAGVQPDGTPVVLELKGQGHAANIAHFWAERAAANPAVARVLSGVVSSGGWLGGIGVHAPLVMAIYAHHVVPAMQARGVTPGQPAADEEAAARPYGPIPSVDDDTPEPPPTIVEPPPPAPAHAHATGDPSWHDGDAIDLDGERPAGWPPDVPWPPAVPLV